MRHVGLAVAAAATFASQAGAQEAERVAVVSAFEPEWQVLKAEMTGAQTRAIDGTTFVTGRLAGQDVVLFLSGISMVNAAMTTQRALENFDIDPLVVSGIAGGVDPALDIGDVVVPRQWGQYLDMIFARETADGYAIPPWMESDFDNYGMMFPRDQTVTRPGATEPETRFWFPVDAEMLEVAEGLAGTLDLAECSEADACLEDAPSLAVGGNGVSGSAFVDNAAFREWVFDTFEARVLDMESAAIAHVAHANDVPFIAFRSLSDLAGGGDADNEMPVFLDIAAQNAARVVMAFLQQMGAE